MTAPVANPARDVRTLDDICRIYAADRPDAVANKFMGRATTYAMLDAHSNQVANALLASGLSKNHRVAYLGKNSDLYFEILFGAAKMRAVCLPIGWRLAASEIAYILGDGEVDLVFVGSEFADLVRQAVDESGRRLTVIDIGAEGADGYLAWRDASSADRPPMEADVDDTALQLYTSGTTGRPKGVMLTHRNLLEMWVEAGQSDLRWTHYSDDDVCLVAMPLAHIAGTGFALVSLLYGASNVIVPEFDPVVVLELMVAERVSKMIMVPAALNFLVQMPDVRDLDFSHLKLVFYGASPIPLDLLRQCMDVFGCDFCQQYGMTETCGTIVYLPPADHDGAGNRRMRSAGLPMPGVDLKIVDEDGNRLEPEAVGEVAIRSSSVMAGYWNNEAATSDTIDAAGWLFSGDAGYLDTEGYLYIHDRLKDMIISGAENIYPAEVESAMFSHPAISEVAVIGVPDDKWGEAVKGVVVLKSGSEASEKDILDHTRSQIAAFKVPKSIDFVAMLPRNATGKVLKTQLREPYWAGRERGVN